MKKILFTILALFFAIETNAQEPTLRNILDLYEKQILPRGFILTDQFSQYQEAEYADEKFTFEVVKDIYQSTYKTSNSADGQMTVAYVYAANKGIGSPSMVITCDAETWRSLKREAASMEIKSTWNDTSDNAYWINENNLFLDFNKSGIITITVAEEEHLTWNENLLTIPIKVSTTIKFSDLLSLYNNRKDQSYVNHLLRSKGFVPKDDGWKNEYLKVTLDCDTMNVEGVNNNDFQPQQGWIEEMEAMGYVVYEDFSGHGQMHIWYEKAGCPIVRTGGTGALFYMALEANDANQVTDASMLHFSDLLAIYERNSPSYTSQLLLGKGFKNKDGVWSEGLINIAFDGGRLRVWVEDPNNDSPFPDSWKQEIVRRGYRGEDYHVGMVYGTLYTKSGAPPIDYSYVSGGVHYSDIYIGEYKPQVARNNPGFNLGYAVYYGKLKNRKTEDVNGRLVFKQRHIIDSRDSRRRVAEAGDYVVGEFSGGHLVQGVWYSSDGRRKGSILIGKQ